MTVRREPAGRRQVVEVARAAEDAGADVLVEVPRDVLDHEADLGDRALQLHRGAGASRPEGEEDVAAPLVERLGGAREEEGRARGRVGRIGDDGVERAHQLRRQRPAEVVLDAVGRERRSGELPLQEGDERRIDVHDREARDRRGRAVVAHEQPERERGQVVVAEQEHAAADEGAGLVDRQEPPELRVDRAVALVELEPGGRPAPDGARELAHERREPGGTTTPRPPHPGHAAVRPMRRPPPAKSARPAGVSCVGRSSATMRPLAELAADGGHDRHRQLGRPADPARRDGLEPGERGQDGADAALALGEPDGGGHLADDAALLSQATGGCSGRSPARHRGATRIVCSTTLPSMSPQREQVDVGEPELGPGVDAQVRLGEQEHARDRAVRKGVELLADDGRAAGVGRGAQDAVQPARSVRTAASRTHASIAYRRIGWVVWCGSGGPEAPRSSSSNRSPSQRLAPGASLRDGELERSAARRSGQATPEKGAELHSHQDAPPSTVA